MDYKPLYRAAFAYHVRWMKPPETLEECEECFKDLKRIAEEHANNEFLLSLLSAIYWEINRQYMIEHDTRKGVNL